MHILLTHLAHGRISQILEVLPNDYVPLTGDVLTMINQVSGQYISCCRALGLIGLNHFIVSGCRLCF